MGELTDPDGPWRVASIGEIARHVVAAAGDGGRLLVLVDGRSASGKTTFADRLGGAIGAPVVHSDDVAWHLHPIDWGAEMTTGVLEPWLTGRDISYRPPGWVAKGRPGSIDVAAGDRLIIEGVGAGRVELARLAQYVVWVHSDERIRRSRGIDRDVADGVRPRDEAETFWDDWAGAEDPFLAADRPWLRADLIVNGSPTAPVPDGYEVLAG